MENNKRKEDPQDRRRNSTGDTDKSQSATAETATEPSRNDQNRTQKPHTSTPQPDQDHTNRRQDYDGQGRTSPNRPAGTQPKPKRTGAIGVCTWPLKPPPKRTSAPMRGNNRAWGFRRLDFKSAWGFDRLDCLAPDADHSKKEEVRGYMVTARPCSTACSNVVQDALDEAGYCGDETLRVQAGEFITHLFSMPRPTELQYIAARLMTKELTGAPSYTEAVWSGLYEAGFIDAVHDYSYKKDRKAREFALSPGFYEELARADACGAPATKKMATGKRSYSEPAQTSTLRDPACHRWGKERTDLPGGHYSLLDGALRILDDTPHPLCKDRLEAVIAHYEEEADVAKQAYEAYCEDLNLESPIIWDGAPKVEFYRLLKRRDETRSRLATMKQVQARINAQTVEEDESGLVQLQNSYEVQSISGRLSFKQGGPQGATRAAKAAMYDGIDGLFNYDIKSSQTEGLRQLAEELQALGADVSVEPINTYLNAGGKDKVVEDTGLPRWLVKKTEHAIKFLGTIPTSITSARISAEKSEHNRNNSLPDIATYALKAADGDENRADEILATLREVFAPQIRTIQKLANALLTVYWRERSTPGGRGKGRVMRNACGVTFCKYDHPPGHKRRSKVMAWYLQGLEAAYVHAITVLSEDHAYDVFANEHDGCITIGEVTQEAKEQARKLSGFERAEFVEKPFCDAEDLILEPITNEDSTSCKTLKSDAKETVKENTAKTARENPNGGVLPATGPSIKESPNTTTAGDGAASGAGGQPNDETEGAWRDLPYATLDRIDRIYEDLDSRQLELALQLAERLEDWVVQVKRLSDIPCEPTTANIKALDLCLEVEALYHRNKDGEPRRAGTRIRDGAAALHSLRQGVETGYIY